MILVKVRDFQAIKSLDIEIDGLTAITGDNSAGKSSLTRAIRYVFFNPGGDCSFVRHGAHKCSVELIFSNGKRVKWEKGWEKPGRKGAKINRYTVNGDVLDRVGNSVPQEVLALGVGPLPIGNTSLWPQIADPVVGQSFLLEETGAVFAEAVADSKRLTKLNTALTECESDGRKAASKLKVRKSDFKEVEKKVQQLEGLEGLEKRIEDISKDREGLLSLKKRMQGLTLLERKLKDLDRDIESLEGSYKLSLVDSDSLDGIERSKSQLEFAVSIQTSMVNLDSEISRFQGIESIKLLGSPLDERNISILGKIDKMVTVFCDLRDEMSSSERDIESYEKELLLLKRQSEELERVIKSLVGDYSECPVCGAAICKHGEEEE